MVFYSPIAGMPKKVVNAKIACLDFSLQKAKMHLGVQVLIENPEKLDAIRNRSVSLFCLNILPLLTYFEFLSFNSSIVLILSVLFIFPHFCILSLFIICVLW